jgi:hypothetical protein
MLGTVHTWALSQYLTLSPGWASIWDVGARVVKKRGGVVGSCAAVHRAELRFAWLTTPQASGVAGQAAAAL